MKKRIISINYYCLILCCLMGVLATPAFATVKIESVVCNNTTGDLTVTFKNQGQGTRTHIYLYSYIKLREDDNWEYYNKSNELKDMNSGDEATQHIGTPDQIVYRRMVTIIDDPLNPNDPQPSEDDSCDENDPRWKLLLWQLDGGYPMDYSGAPGQVVHVQFGAEYINTNNAGGNLAASCSVVDDKGVKGVVMAPNWVAYGTWGLVQVDIQIPNNALNGWRDSVTLTVGDPISLTKTVTCVTGVPTVSERGLIVMGLLLLTVGTVFLLRHRRVVTGAASGG